MSNIDSTIYGTRNISFDSVLKHSPTNSEKILSGGGISPADSVVYESPRLLFTSAEIFKDEPYILYKQQQIEKFEEQRQKEYLYKKLNQEKQEQEKLINAQHDAEFEAALIIMEVKQKTKLMLLKAEQEAQEIINKVKQHHPHQLQQQQQQHQYQQQQQQLQIQY